MICNPCLTAASIKRCYLAIIIKLLFLLPLLTADLAYAGDGAWTRLGPEGGYIQILAVDPQTPQTLYAGTLSGGIFKSVDGGGSWNPASSGLPDAPVYHLAIDPQTPQTLYASTFYSVYGGHGMYKSTDGGGSWQPIDAALPHPFVNAIAIDPQSPQKLYAGTMGGGIFVSDQSSLPILTVLSSVDDDTPDPGQRVQSYITIDNSGTADATGVTVLSTSNSFLTFAEPGWLEPPGVTLPVPNPPTLASGLTITAGHQITLTFPATVSTHLTPGTIITSSITVTSTELTTPVTSTVPITITPGRATYLPIILKK